MTGVPDLLPLDIRSGKLAAPIQVRLSDATRQALAELAAREGQTVAGMARVLIMQGIIRRRARSRAPDVSALTVDVPR